MSTELFLYLQNKDNIDGVEKQDPPNCRAVHYQNCRVGKKYKKPERTLEDAEDIIKNPKDLPIVKRMGYSWR